MRYWIVTVAALLLIGVGNLAAGIVIGSKSDAAFAMKAFFEAGFSCGRGDSSRTVDDCWLKYRDIVER